MHEGRGEFHSHQQQVHQLLEERPVYKVRDQQDHVIRLEEKSWGGGGGGRRMGDSNGNESVEKKSREQVRE